MHFNRFSSTKTYFKVCIEAQRIFYYFLHVNPYYILSTIILNDMRVDNTSTITVQLTSKFTKNACIASCLEKF